MAYTRVNWEDLPSTNTPRNATNLNNMDAGIKENNDMLTGASPAGNMIVDSIRSKNMFNKNTATRGYYISDTGVITSFSDVFYSDFIPVKPNTRYSVSGKTDWQVTALYDNNKTFISRINDTDLITTSNTYYIRTLGLIANINDIQVEKGSVVTPYSPYQNLDNSGTILFDGESTSADIQLLDSLNKYEYVDIFYGNIYSGIKKNKFKVLNSNTFILSSFELDNGNNNFGIAIIVSKYIFDTNYLRYNFTSRIFKYENDNNWVQDRINSNYIYRVVGY